MKVGKIVFCDRSRGYGFIKLSDVFGKEKMVYFHFQSLKKVRRNGKFDESFIINSKKKKKIFCSLGIGKKIVVAIENLEADSPQAIAWGIMS